MEKYFHSVVLDKDMCNGCTNCMRRCPNEAIRVRNKKAVIMEERCIDCGECIRVCPYHAQNSITDSLDDLKNYKYNIAIPSISLYGQFTSSIDIDKVFEGIMKLGFDYIYDEGLAADIATEVIKDMIKDKSLPKPIISSFCPAIVRLIQVKYPSLIDNIIKIESPMEIAGRIAKGKISKKYGLPLEQIGVFYLTQCPARVTSIKNPLGTKKSSINGAISIKDIFGDLMKNMKNSSNPQSFDKASPLGIGWARVGGQSYSIGIENYVAVDGIENVIKVLEEIEMGRLDGVEFFEGLACVGGCVGGPLNVVNPFIAKSIIRNLSQNTRKAKLVDKDYINELCHSGYIYLDEEILPRPIMTLDSDIQKAMKKLEKIKEIYKKLPGLDCGSCGAPSCHALAEDIVRGTARIDDCIFKLKEKVNKNK